MTVSANTPRRKAGRPRRDLKFARVPHPYMEQRCIEITSHARTKTGYAALRPRKGGYGHTGKAHRLAYLSKHGEGSIPPGWEVDHICRNRACVNRSHLQVLPRGEHKGMTNAERAEDRIEQGRCLWEAHGRPGPTAFARLAGVPKATASRWIRDWKREERERLSQAA